MATTQVAGARLGSLVLGSADPERLGDWYRAVFSPGGRVVDGVLDLGSQRLIFERAEVAARTAEPGRLVLNIYVDDFAVIEKHLHTLDLTWVRPVERIRIGTVATLEDADGSHVNILELLPEYRPAG